MTGTFLVFDGLDGTGKSTQCRMLADFLTAKSIPVTLTRDPGGTDVALKIREIVLGRQHAIDVRTEAMLFGAARSHLVEQVIRPALARGEVVVSDRYSLANVVYQGHAGGWDVDELHALEKFVTQGVQPDLTLILDLPVDEAARRRGRDDDRMEAKGRAYLDRVRQGYLAEAAKPGNRCVVVDARGSVEEIFERVQAVVMPLVA